MEFDGQPLESIFTLDFPLMLEKDEYLIFDSSKDCWFDQNSSSGISCSLRDLSTIVKTMDNLRVSDGDVYGLYAGICGYDKNGNLNNRMVTFKSTATIFSLEEDLSSNQIDLESFIDIKFSKDRSTVTANRCKIAFLGGIHTPEVLDDLYSLDIETIIRSYHFAVDEIEKLGAAIMKISNSKNTDLVHGKLIGLSRVAKELQDLRDDQAILEISDEDIEASATLCDRLDSAQRWFGFKSKLAFWILPNSDNCRIYLEIEKSYRTEGSSIPVIFRYKDSEGSVLKEEETYFFSGGTLFHNNDCLGIASRYIPLETRKLEVEILEINDSKLTVHKKEFVFDNPNSVELDFDFIKEAELQSANSESAKIRYRLNPALENIAPLSSFDMGDLWVCFTISETPLTPLEMIEGDKGACGRMFGFLQTDAFLFSETKIDFGSFWYWEEALFGEEVNAYLYSEEVNFSSFKSRSVFYPLGKVAIPRP